MFFNSSSFRNISKAYTLKGFYKIQKKNYLYVYRSECILNTTVLQVL